MRFLFAVMLALIPTFLPAGDIAKEAANVRISPIAHVTESTKDRSIWLASIGAMLGANIADVYTSYQDSKIPGLRELNPLVSTGGQYNIYKGISFKAIMCGAMLGYEIHDHRKNGGAHDKGQAIVNFSNAGLYGFIAIHNHSLIK